MGRGSLSPAPQHPGTAVKGTRSRHFRSEESALRPPLSGCRHSSDRRSRLRARQLNPAPLTSRCPHFAARAATLDAGPPGSVSPPPPTSGYHRYAVQAAILGGVAIAILSTAYIRVLP